MSAFYKLIIIKVTVLLILLNYNSISRVVLLDFQITLGILHIQLMSYLYFSILDVKNIYLMNGCFEHNFLQFPF